MGVLGQWQFHGVERSGERDGLESGAVRARGGGDGLGGRPAPVERRRAAGAADRAGTRRSRSARASDRATVRAGRQRRAVADAAGDRDRLAWHRGVTLGSFGDPGYGRLLGIKLVFVAASIVLATVHGTPGTARPRLARPLALAGLASSL